MNTYKSNSKEVSSKVQDRVKAYYDNDIELLKADTEAAGGSIALIEGGTFDAYYTEQREFLNTLHLNNNSGREFDDQEVWEMYKLLVSRAVDKLIKETK